MFAKIIIALDNHFITDLFTIGTKRRYLKYSNLLSNVEFYIHHLVINVKSLIHQSLKFIVENNYQSNLSLFKKMNI